MSDVPEWPHVEGPKHHLAHDDAARTAVDDAHVAVTDANDAVDDARHAARQAVADAREAVLATASSLDDLASMLHRHYRLGVFAVVVAIIAGATLLILGTSIRNTQESVAAQAKTNEVEVLRHRVNERDGHYRLCMVAFDATRTTQEADAICRAVLGDDYDALKAKVTAQERQLVKARNGG